jgi:hypothetical protein
VRGFAPIVVLRHQIFTLPFAFMRGASLAVARTKEETFEMFKLDEERA